MLYEKSYNMAFIDAPPRSFVCFVIQNRESGVNGTSDIEVLAIETLASGDLGQRDLGQRNLGSEASAIENLRRASRKCGAPPHAIV